MKPWIKKKRIIKAWIKKKLGIASPSSYFRGYKYEYDRLMTNSYFRGYKNEYDRLMTNDKTKERLWNNAINADEITADDEIMQDSKWDEIYKEVEE